MYKSFRTEDIDLVTVPTEIDSLRPYLLKLDGLFIHFTQEEAEKIEYLFSSALDHRSLEAESVPATPFYKDVKAKVFPS